MLKHVQNPTKWGKEIVKQVSRRDFDLQDYGKFFLQFNLWKSHLRFITAICCRININKIKIVIYYILYHSI